MRVQAVWRCATGGCKTVRGLAHDGPRGWRKLTGRGSLLGRGTGEGESPVPEICESPCAQFLSTTGHEEPCRKRGRPRSKAKYRRATDREEYREGTVKRTPVRGVKENLKP